MVAMTVASNGNPSTHFGRQVKKERLARGWSLRELAARSDVDYSYLSKIEAGKRPPTETVADAMDNVFKERKGWFREFYEDSKHAIPAAFRDWSEYESKAAELLIWVPNIFDGSVQTEPYARELLVTYPGVDAETAEKRLKNRLERQRWLLRDDGPTILLLVDMAALARLTGSAEIMAGQCAHLAQVSQLDAVTVQVVPPIRHPLATASLMVADDDAAYSENCVSGSVYTDPERVTSLRRILSSVRGEAAKVSESLRLIQEADKRWTGVSQHSAATADRRASKQRATAERSL